MSKKKVFPTLKPGLKVESVMVDIYKLNLGMTDNGQISLGVEGKKGVLVPEQSIDFTNKFNAMMDMIFRIHNASVRDKMEISKKGGKLLGLDGKILN